MAVVAAAGHGCGGEDDDELMFESTQVLKGDLIGFDLIYRLERNIFGKLDLVQLCD